jgi:hypothetical protein
MVGQLLQEAASERSAPREVDRMDARGFAVASGLRRRLPLADLIQFPYRRQTGSFGVTGTDRRICHRGPCQRRLNGLGGMKRFLRSLGVNFRGLCTCGKQCR